MEGMIIILGGSGIFAAIFYLWLCTKKGQAWLDQL